METNSNDKIKKMFSDYEKSHEKKNIRRSREEILAKYFRPINSKEVFRMLPPKDNRDYVETAFFHQVQTNTSGGKKIWRKLYCLAKNEPKIPKLDSNNEPIVDNEGKQVMVMPNCPLCAKSKKLIKTQDPSLKGIQKEKMTKAQLEIKTKNDKIYKDAMKWDAKKFYIIRGIDKGQPKDGVKFWRFKHNFKKQGIRDKLTAILDIFYHDTEIDFTDIEKGTDLIITVVDNEISGTGRTFRDVSSIITRGSSKLFEDPIVVQQWLNDDITWRDVFKPTKTRVLDAFGFLERVSMGTDPYWDDSDQENKHWVYPSPADADLQKKANTRDQNLDANERQDNAEVASDIITESYSDTTEITSVTSEDVGTYKDDAVDVSKEVVDNQAEDAEPITVEEVTTGSDDYDDLPF